MRIIRGALTFALAFTLSAPALTAAAAPFDSVRYSGSTAYLSGGFTMDGNRAGMIATSSDDGVTWRGGTIANTHLIGTAVSGSQVWAVSSFSKTPFLGTDLAFAATSAISGPASDAFGGIVATGADSAIAVGQAGPIDSYGDPAAVWTTTDGGASWTTQLLTPKLPQNPSDGSQPEVNSRLRAADVAGSSIFAAGIEWQADSLGLQADRAKSLVYKSTDSGSTWTQQTVTTNPVADLIGIDAFDATNVWAVGLAAGASSNGTVVRTTDGGSTWTQTAIPLTVANSATIKPVPTSIAAIDATKAIVGCEGGLLLVDASTGTPKFTWKPVAGGKTIRSVAMRDASNGIAVGDGETVLRTTDGGQTWSGTSVVSAPTLAVTSPSKGFSVASGVKIPIVGTASDATGGVSAVQIQILRADGYYWNGSAFADKTPKWLNATTSDGFQNWSYDWTPTSSGTSVIVNVRAFDLSGNVASAAPVVPQQLGTAVSVSATTPNYASTAYATVTLKTTQGGAVNGKKITLQRWNGKTWSTVGYQTAGATSSSVKFTVSGLTSKTKFRASFATDAAFNSSYRDFYITPKVSLGTPKLVKRSGRTITVSSTIKPRHTAKSRPVKVTAYKRYGSTYKPVKTWYCSASNYSSYSKYTGSVKLTSGGTYKLRAYAPADSGHAATYSSYSGTFTVK